MRRGFGLTALVVLVVLTQPASAERLPVTFYTASNGLPHDRVKCLVRDSTGFVWFCSASGLSRYDGTRFVTYGVSDGLSHPSINDLIEAKDGTYWVATNGGGVCRFQPRAHARAAGRAFIECSAVGEGLANRVNAIAVDLSGRLWVGTDAGLFVRGHGVASGRFERESAHGPPTNVWAIATDSVGDVWVGSNRGLARYGPNGFVARYDVDPSPRNAVWALMFDRTGRLWIGHDSGALVVKPIEATTGEPTPPLWRRMIRSSAGSASLAMPAEAGDARALGPADGLTIRRPGTFVESADGHVWIGSELWAAEEPGVVEFDGAALRTYTTAQGLSADPIIAVTEDRDRNIWLATTTGGVTRLARSGLVAYGEPDGLSPGRVHAIIRGPGRAFYVVTTGLVVHRFDGTRFIGTHPNTGASTWSGFQQAPLVDRQGEWWIPTDNGLYRFARVSRIEELARARPAAVYGAAHGLPGTGINNPFEDARGDIWFGVMGFSVVARWERRTDRISVFGEEHGIPRAGPAMNFTEARNGDLWVGFDRGAAARFRGGRFESFGAASGLPWGQIGTLHFDRRGRLWLGSRDAALAYRAAAALQNPSDRSNQGEAELTRIDEPVAATPRFSLYPPQFLGGEGVRAIAEDETGLLYIGGDKGVQRINPDTGAIRRYAIADGLPSDDVEAAFVDSDNRLWFGTWRGLARFIPPTGAAAPPPDVLIADVRIRGVPQAIPELGTPALTGLTLEPDQNQIEIGYTVLSFGTGGGPKYQYRLEGADAGWSQPSDDRRVTYVTLAPGGYRFLVRAVTADGTVTDPATIAFVILRPVWQRPWFVALSLALLGLAVSLVHRARVSRLVAVERMRTRIATDLHDDIGASLSQIAVLAEVMRQRHPGEAELHDPLGRIADTSRELIASMSDIVWAINPRRDSLTDVVQRMRRFASDVLTARGIAFSVDSPDGDRVRLGADVRRHVYLIFKESINNLVRHSGATSARIELAIDHGRLMLGVDDDGVGFDAGEAHAGHGLASLRARALSIGGSLQVDSAPGRGTRLRLEVPLGPSGWRLRRNRVPRQRSTG